MRELVKYLLGIVIILTIIYTIFISYNVFVFINSDDSNLKIESYSKDIELVAEERALLEEMFNDANLQESSNDINISNVNWCTPFYEIEDLLLEYSVIQYGMEMHLKATKIKLQNNIKSYNMEEGFIFLESKKYLSEIKSMLSIFNCND